MSGTGPNGRCGRWKRHTCGAPAAHRSGGRTSDFRRSRSLLEKGNLSAPFHFPRVIRSTPGWPARPAVVAPALRRPRRISSSRRRRAGAAVALPSASRWRQPPGTRTMPNRPVDILSAWMALEALSPQTFRNRSEFKLGQRRVLDFDIHHPPWMDANPRDEQAACFYQVVLGTISMERAFGRLVETYGDERPERPVADGQAILATLTVDERGVPAGSASAAVSCFAWALPIALNRQLDRLDGWTDVRRALRTGLRACLERSDPEGELMPLDGPTLGHAYEWLLEKLRLDRKLVVPPAFCVRSPRRDAASPPPESLLLDSFFLEDLVAARDLFLQDQAPPALRGYLQVDRPAAQLPLGSQAPESLDAALRFTLPRWFPPARWPGRGRHPLVLNQQLAVNAAMSADADRPLLAVNGPPGTGKTTLLRDIVAANVVGRAEAMASFEQPSDAFSRYVANVVEVDGRRLGYYPVAPEIRGFEMLVVSSNNKAVENVTAELPDMGAIAEDAVSLRYLKTVSDSVLRPRKTWGLMAAVLGSGANRRAFRESFWWDATLVYHYLDFIRLPRPERTPRRRKDSARPVILNERPPGNPADAQARWQKARQLFREARTAVRDHAARLQSVWDFMVRDSVRDRRQRELRVRRERHQASRPGWLASIVRPGLPRVAARGSADRAGNRGGQAGTCGSRRGIHSRCPPVAQRPQGRTAGIARPVGGAVTGRLVRGGTGRARRSPDGPDVRRGRSRGAAVAHAVVRRAWTPAARRPVRRSHAAAQGIHRRRRAATADQSWPAHGCVRRPAGQLQHAGRSGAAVGFPLPGDAGRLQHLRVGATHAGRPAARVTRLAPGRRGRPGGAAVGRGCAHAGPAGGGRRRPAPDRARRHAAGRVRAEDLRALRCRRGSVQRAGSVGADTRRCRRPVGGTWVRKRSACRFWSIGVARSRCSRSPTGSPTTA